MMSKTSKIALIITAVALLMILAIALLKRNSKGVEVPAPQEEESFVEYGEIAYSDLVSTIVNNYQCGWGSSSPEDFGLSMVYRYESPYAGFLERDLNGDGIKELILGENLPDAPTIIYDLYTINPQDGSLIHLASGGERDRFYLLSDTLMVEEGVNSAFDSFEKMYVLKSDTLQEVKGYEKNDNRMRLELETFAKYAYADLTEYVQKVYADVIASLENEKDVDLEKRYCSKEFCALRHEVDSVDAMFVDWNLWLQTQDFENPKAELKSVKMKGCDTAMVIVQVNNFGKDKETRLSVVREETEWKIDDFFSEYEFEWYSQKEKMKKLLGR